ncbi:MAG: hypothetical protein RIS94_1154 [Pseudomonadota bacterium]|jgi:hypothetical protein
MSRLFKSVILPACALIGAGPALAHDHHEGGAMPLQGVYQGTWQGGSWNGQWMPAAPAGSGTPYYPPQGYPAPQGYAEPDTHAREMLERCQSYRRDNGVGGAVIGGVVGGVIGNRVASGNRTLGTVAGAAVGAVAGSAIDKAEDNGRDRECADFWRSYSAPMPQGGYGAYPGYGYGYPMGYVMVPVMIQQGPARPCVETRTVTYEYVTSPRRRLIPPRARPHDKRVKEKRVYTGS